METNAESVERGHITTESLAVLLISLTTPCIFEVGRTFATCGNELEYKWTEKRHTAIRLK